MRWFSRKQKAQHKTLEFDMHVRLGDAANAARNWEVAAKHYRDAVRARPDDSAIWIQLGHSLKEQDLLKEAETAYRSAIKAADDNADAYLHLGHVSKMQKHPSDAIEAYKAAARLGSTGRVGKDARRELATLGIDPPSVVSIVLPASFDDEPDYRDLLEALRNQRWKKAKAAIRHLPGETAPEIKLAEAKLLHLLGRFDDAVALYKDDELRGLGKVASEALMALYADQGATEERARFAAWEIGHGLKKAAPFDTIAGSVAHLAKMGKLDLAFEAADPLFQSAKRTATDRARSAVDVKRDRGSSHFTKALATRFRDDFRQRATELETAGEHAQAALLRDEAQALEQP